MKNKKHIAADCLFTVLTLLIVFGTNLFLQSRFQTYTMTPMVFVLGVGYRMLDQQE